jgi:hypothetical protein
MYGYSILRPATWPTRGGIDIALACAWSSPNGWLIDHDEVSALTKAHPGRILGVAGADLDKPMQAVRVPMLPACIVRRVWDDPRRIPYLLIWRGVRDGKVKEALRVIPNHGPTGAPSVKIKRTDGRSVHVSLVWRPQPHGGRSLLLRCWSCRQPCRALYGARVGDDGRFYVARRADWECRTCANLRYSSEGGALVVRTRCKILRPLSGLFSGPRPKRWFPDVFSSPRDAAVAGVCALT